MEQKPDPGDAYFARPTSLWGWIATGPTILAAVTLFILMAMTFADVVLRSAFDAPIEWASELTRIFLAVIVFSCLPMVSWKSQHIIVDLMDPVFSKRAAHIRDIIIDLACGVLLLWPAKRVWDLAERARDFGDVTEHMEFPQHLIGWFIAAFTLVTALVFIARGVVRIFAPHKLLPQAGAQ